MRILALVLLIVLALLQFRLWLSDDGVREVRRLEAMAEGQKRENGKLRARNEKLAAEVKDLKEGLAAVEERARSDLGMVGANESFYQVVPAEPKAAPAASPSLDAPADVRAGRERSSRQAAAK